MRLIHKCILYTRRYSIFSPQDGRTRIHGQANISAADKNSKFSHVNLKGKDKQGWLCSNVVGSDLFTHICLLHTEKRRIWRQRILDFHTMGHGWQCRSRRASDILTTIKWFIFLNLFETCLSWTQIHDQFHRRSIGLVPLWRTIRWSVRFQYWRPSTVNATDARLLRRCFQK